MPKHKCHIYKCLNPCPPKYLMCPEHWSMVPLHLKTPVIVNFQPEQCKGKVRPTSEWLKAARAAINHVEFNCIKRVVSAKDECPPGPLNEDPRGIADRTFVK
jgi:hypothetical protein